MSSSPLADWAEYVDPAQPMDPAHPLNIGRVLWLYGVANSGWTGGKTLRDIVRGVKKPNDATLNNSPTWSVSPFGRALTTNGSTQTATTTVTGTTTVSYAFAAWMKYNGTLPGTTYRVAADFGGGVSARSTWLGLFTNGKWNISHSSAANDINGPNGDTKWHRLLGITLGSTAGFYAYVDGVLIGSSASSILTRNSDAVTIGNYGSGSFYWDGKIADVSVWDLTKAHASSATLAAFAALDYDESRKGYPEALRRISRTSWFLADVPARVDAPYGVTRPTVPQDQVDPAQPMDAGYPLNACRLLWLYGPKNSGWAGGITFRDLTRGSRNPHDGSLVNAPAWQDSRYGRAVKMTAASSHYVDLTAFDPYIVGATKVVASAWFNRTAATYSSFFRGTNSTNGFGLIWFNDNILYAIADRGSGIGAGFVYTTANTSTGWQHVQIAYDGSQSTNTTKMRIWLNGVPLSLSSVGTVATSVVSGGTVWRLGQFDSSGVKYQTGATADHSVWIGRLWTDADARNLYEQSRQGYPDAINWLGRSSWTQTPGALSPITGDAALTQGIFTLTATGTVAVAGTSALTQVAQSLAAAGGVSVAGAAPLTQAANTTAGAGAVAVAGAASQTQGADTSAAAGAVAIAGAAAVTQSADMLASAGSLTITGGAALTQAGDATTGAGAVSIVGGAGITEAGQTLASAGAVAIAGASAMVQAGQTLTADGAVAIGGSGVLVQGGDTLTAFGVNGVQTLAFIGWTAAPSILSWSAVPVDPTWTAVPSGMGWIAGGDEMAGGLVRNTLVRSPGDDSPVWMDFGDCPELADGSVTITSCAVTESGTSALTIGNGGVATVDNEYRVSIPITGGVDGTTYYVRLYATLSNSKHIERIAPYKVLS